MEEQVLTDIKNIGSKFIGIKNHLFIIVDDCTKLKIDDDGDLVFSNDDENDLYQKFDELISANLNEDLFHICRITTPLSLVWKKIMDDSSIVNLTETEITLLSNRLIKKSTSMTLSDKKREIKTSLKNINLDDKLSETGYVEMYDNIVQYYKLIYQKKIVCENYLSEFNNCTINLEPDCSQNLNNLLKEIYEISYLKTDMLDELVKKVNNTLLSKLTTLYSSYKNRIVINSNSNIISYTLNTIDAYTYHKFLIKIMDLSREHKLSNIMEITQSEIEIVNKLIIDHHNKEVEKITDLDKIISVLEIFSETDKNTLLGLFEKLKSNDKIITENMDKMDKWISFIDRCLKLNISNDAILRLVEELIMAKIVYYTAMINKPNKDVHLSIIYPQCLHVFLLSNLNKNFIFKKLYMFTSYKIRYSGVNITDLIKNINSDQYHQLLILENKLLELVSDTNVDVDVDVKLINDNSKDKIRSENMLPKLPTPTKNKIDSESKVKKTTHSVSESQSEEIIPPKPKNSLTKKSDSKPTKSEKVELDSDSDSDSDSDQNTHQKNKKITQPKKSVVETKNPVNKKMQIRQDTKSKLIKPQK